MTSAATKPATLLRQLAQRKGQKLTARDAAALLLAASTLDEQQRQISEHVRVYGDVLRELVDHKTRADTLQDGLRGLLEIVT